MRPSRRLIAMLLVFVVALPLLAADEAKTLFNKGRDAEARQDYITAYEAYHKAWELKPKDLEYRASMERMRFEAAAQYIHQGQKLRDQGRLQEALEAFEKAAEIDPANALAKQEIAKTKALMSGATLVPQPALPVEQLNPLPKAVLQAGGPVLLAPISNQPITLKLTGDTRQVYETIGKLAGINVLFDPDYTSRRIAIELNGVTLSQALDIVALQSRTFWRPVTSNTIFVAADTQAKRRELQQNVIKTFYLANLSQATDVQDIVNTVRNILEVQRVQPLPAQKAFVVRGTPDQVALVEKIVNDLDKARPEVLVDIAVMQVSRDKLRNLGIAPPASATVQLVPAGTTTTTTTGGTTTTTGTTTTAPVLTINDLANLKATNFQVTIPSATANFLFSDSNTKIIQNPQIRVLDGQKASLKIGERVPVATGSFQPGIGGVGINPLVNTQFQYIDVGVNIDVTPQIHADHEVSLKMMVDVSAVTGQTSIGGISQPIIGQRKIEHDIRLRDGEVSLLGGIFENNDIKSISGIPGLAQIPIIKYLFGSENVEHRQNEIVFVIIPHIVREPDITPENLRTIDVGTATSIELRNSGMQPQAAPGGAVTTPTPAPAAAPAAAAPAPATAAGMTISFDPATVNATAGSSFVVNVVAANARDLYAVPMEISYDPSVLQFVNVSSGDLLARDGQAVALVHREDNGQLHLSATRASGGVNGSGTVFALTFLAKQPGQTQLQVNAAARGPSMQSLPVTATPATVMVK